MASNLISGTSLSAIQNPAPEFGYSYNGVIKLDHTFSQRHNISARAFLGQGSQTAPVGQSDVNPWYFEIAPLHVYNYSVADNYVISPSITNSVTIGVNYFNQTFSDAETGFGDLASAGFVTGAPFPNAPNIKISGFEPTGNTPPEGRNDITGHIDEALNWTFGKHQVRFGGEYRQMQLNEFYWRHAVGTFTFDTNYLADGNGENASPWDALDGEGNPVYDIDPKVKSLANFLTGHITQAAMAFGNPERTVYSHAYDLFAQGQLPGDAIAECELRAALRLYAADA